jgi:NAD(P)H dehydrogenase (quinone)
MAKRVLVILGHPAAASYCGALSEAYVAAATAAGHEVRLLRLGELAFEPILHAGYRRIQALEPDLLAAQAAISWAEHLCWVFPVWWGGVPALLKGFLERVFLPGFAFKYRAGAAFPEQLLRGRTAHLLVPMDTPPWYFKWIYRMPAIQQMEKTTLAFCGIKPLRTLMLGPLISATTTQRQAWLAQASALAARL